MADRRALAVTLSGITSSGIAHGACSPVVDDVLESIKRLDFDASTVAIEEPRKAFGWKAVALKVAAAKAATATTAE